MLDNDTTIQFGGDGPPAMMLRHTFYCADDTCHSSEVFILQVDPLASPHEDDTAMRLLATGCGWRIDNLEDEAWCPRHRAGEMSGI